MSLIKDKNQFDLFVSILPDLINDEVYFISLSCRNKYLSKEEREYYSLGRTEMFARNIIRSKDKIEYTLNKLESALYYKKTNNGNDLPLHSLVTYININPSSMIKAYFSLNNIMNNQILEINSALQNNKLPNYSHINLLDRELMNCIQRSRSRKIFIDIDFDIKDQNIISEFKNKFIDSTNLYIIKTKGGYHCLINLNSMKFKNNKDNLFSICQYYNNLVKENKGEVIINKNAMIPLPGTLQANELVSLISI